MEITVKLVGTVVASLTLIFGCWFFIESRINEKVDKSVFDIRLELKDARLQNVENVNNIKIVQIKEDIKENQATLQRIEATLNEIIIGE